MNPFLELKNNGSVKDVDVKSRVVAGYLSHFGNIDSDNDIITQGAFTKSINERKDKIFFLLQHNWEKPLGKFNVLQEDEKGLYFEGEIANTTYGNDLIELYSSGIVNEHSIGFNVLKSDNDAKGVRTIKEIRLWEGSAVTLGANSSTPFLGFKSELKDLQEKQSKILKALKEGSFTDETFVMLEFALKQLMSDAYNLKSTQQSEEPQVSTLEIDLEPQVIKSMFNNFKI